MEITATAQVAALGEWMEMGRDKIDEVKMAVVEACINAFEHSCDPGPQGGDRLPDRLEDAGRGAPTSRWTSSTRERASTRPA